MVVNYKAELDFFDKKSTFYKRTFEVWLSFVTLGLKIYKVQRRLFCAFSDESTWNLKPQKYVRSFSWIDYYWGRLIAYAWLWDLSKSVTKRACAWHVNHAVSGTSHLSRETHNALQAWSVCVNQEAEQNLQQRFCCCWRRLVTTPLILRGNISDLVIFIRSSQNNYR